ncbi:MAG: hypothetical protein QNJ90_07680 [Planctomycetota bacterium]|nr:hypothetical protein [Planctomycetota bacterium]
MRRPGFRDAMIALKLYELRREPDLRTSRDLLRNHILGKEWDRIRELLEEGHPENLHLRQTMTYWELAASFVNRGLLHPDVYLDACDEGLLLYAALEEHLPRIRKVRPRFASQTEAVLRDHPVVRGRVLELRSEVFKRRKEEGK